MITLEEIAASHNLVVWLGLGTGLILGWIAQYGRFCTLGAIADWYALGDTSRLRMWGLAILVAIAGTQSLSMTGLIQATDSFYLAPRVLWLSNVVGGLLFGIGMTLASGCGNRALIRLGGGSLKSVVVFLVMAIAAYMTLRGIFGVLRVNTLEKVFIELDTHQDLIHLTTTALNHFGQTPLSMESSLSSLLAPAFIGIVCIASLALIFNSAAFRDQPRYILTGIVVGLLVVAGWYITGHLGFIEEDPNTLEARYLAVNTRSIESLTFVAPLAYWLELFLFWSDTSKTMTFGIATVTGVVAGAWIYAKGSGSFQWEGFKDRTDLAYHLIGAALMGIGGVIAMGCTIGHGISGISMLALGSLIATGSIVAGAWLTLMWIERRA
jgi:uncharacterized membrane protein YedE/YeeE